MPSSTTIFSPRVRWQTSRSRGYQMYFGSHIVSYACILEGREAVVKTDKRQAGAV